VGSKNTLNLVSRGFMLEFVIKTTKKGAIFLYGTESRSKVKYYKPAFVDQFVRT